MSAVDSDGGAGAARVDERVLRALVRLASIVTTGADPADLVEVVAETSRELLMADSLSISEVSPDRTVLRTVINVGDLGPGEVRWPTNESYRIADFPDTLGFLIGQPVRQLVTQVSDPTAEPAEIELLRSLGKHSSLKTPIIVDNRMWGEMWASRGAGRPAFTPYDGDIAEVIVGLVSAGLSQASAWHVLQQMAMTDPLTGLANRRAFDEHLSRHLARTQSMDWPLAVVVADVNGLKRVNDTHGHAAGDDALIHVALAARAATADLTDTLAGRLGGDEFALILPGQDLAAATSAAQRWCRAAVHTRYGTTLACGLALSPGRRAVDSRDLLRAADQAQYRAKRTGSSEPVVAQE